MVSTHAGKNPEDYPLGLVPQTVHTNACEGPVAGTWPFYKYCNQFESMGQAAGIKFGLCD